MSSSHYLFSSLPLDWLERGAKSWFGSLKLGQKIGFGYALALGVAILGTTTGFLVGDHYQNVAQREKKDAADELDLANRLRVSMLAIGVDHKDSILTLREPSTWRSEYARFLAEKSNLQAIWQEFRASQGTISNEINEIEGEEKIIEELAKNYEVFISDLQKLEMLFQQKNLQRLSEQEKQSLQTELIEFHNQVLLGDASRFSKQLDRFTEQAIIETREAKEDLVVAENLRLRIIVASLALSIAIATVLAFLVSRAITVPIRSAADVAQQVIETANFELQASVTSKDEVGVLTSSLNQLITKVNLLLQEQKEKNESLKNALYEIQSTQAVLVQSEKMSSLGHMVAGIAHEINNPVNFIHGNLFHLQEYLHELIHGLTLYQQHVKNLPDSVQEQLDEIDLDFLREDFRKILGSMQLGTERITEIVRSLRNFSRLDEAEVKAVDIHDGIDGTLIILAHRMKASPQAPEIQVVKNYAVLPLVECYAGQLNQVFMNILSNAIDAFEEMNQHRSYEEIAANPNTIHIQTELASDKQVIIRIRDSGAGIPQSVVNKIFDPFFTTKEVGKGTGLGLSISYKVIVEKHGGSLSCVSELGQGTEFVIQIPLHQSESSTKKA